VGIITQDLLEISFSLQQCKNFWNRLRFDKVIAKVRDHSFFGTQCSCMFYWHCLMRQECLNSTDPAQCWWYTHTHGRTCRAARYYIPPRLLAAGIISYYRIIIITTRKHAIFAIGISGKFTWFDFFDLTWFPWPLGGQERDFDWVCCNRPEAWPHTKRRVEEMEGHSC